MEVRRYKKRNLWVSGSESRLIDVWKSKVEELRQVRKNSHIIEKMAEELQQLGVKCTPSEIHTKMHNLTSRYRRENNQIAKSGGIPSDWPPYKEMHQLFALYKSQDFVNSTEDNIRVSANELNMDVEQVGDKTKIPCSDLKKCGEIATLLSVGKPEFFLNCGFCEFTFMQLDNFVQHMYQEHLSEFTRVEIKQEGYDMERILEGEYDPVPSHDNTEENDCGSFGLNEFERVEIGSDKTDRSSLEVKEETENSYLSEEISQLDTIEEVSKPNKRVLHSRLNRYDSNHMQTDTHEESDDSELLVEMGMTKTAPDVDHEREIEEILNYSLNEAEQTSNYEENGDDYRLEDEDQIYSDSEYVNSGKLVNRLMNDSKEAQAKSNLIPTAMAPVSDSTLKYSQYAILSSTYKRYRCLWDETHIAYRFKNRREEALKSLQEEFNNKSGLNLNAHDLEYEIKKLRKRCSHEKETKIKCKRHKLVYRPTCGYYKDIEYLEVDVPPFECKICGKLLPGLSHYKVHLALHDGSLPFKCHLCKQAFKLSQNLTVHLRRHVQDFVYSCEVCNKLCATSTEKKIHMRSHTGEKPFVCYICGYKAITSSHLLVHIRRHQKRPRYKCKFCSKMYYQTGELKEHMVRHRNIRDQICDICNKGFKSTKQLRQHILIHNTTKKYSCRICSKRFAQMAGLSCHMRSHGTRNMIERHKK